MVPNPEIIEEPIADLGILCCPKCSDRLEPLFLDTSGEGNDRKQTIWWTCRWVSSKKCDFPLNMPSNVYWVTRTGPEIDRGFVPLPRVDLLPRRLQYLYPQIFPDSPRPSKDAFFSLESLSSESPSPVSKPERKKVANNAHNSVEASRKLLAEILKSKKAVPPTQQVSRKSEAQNSFYRNRVKARRREEIKPEMDHVRFNSDQKAKPVEVFPDHKGALSSLINLRYSHETFIDNLNSEMCRKKILTPTPAIDPRQRAQMEAKTGKHGKTLCDFVANSTTKKARYVYNDGDARWRKKISRETREKHFYSLLASLPKQLSDKSIVTRLGIPILPCRDCNTPASTELSMSTASTSTGSREAEAVDSIDDFIKSTGNPEIDQLIRQQFRNVLKNKKLRRKKGSRSRTPQVMPQNPPLTEEAVTEDAEELFRGFSELGGMWQGHSNQEITRNDGPVYQEMQTFNLETLSNPPVDPDTNQEHLQDPLHGLPDTNDPHSHFYESHNNFFDLDATTHFDEHHGLHDNI
ncbi:unnamed protein product [Bursaphelenchus xylophilus]|uniref:(pine wood nematode) hypothetical protein n=1 Tax=Bursaphelenchus xylophilus TaxID=6326 RepID=A0A1I7RL32_BURXY|nr:unnamed protein product [Bursaphelenchus xylophilus]CAG9083524.1 unnamed protein product [Bursaphelenchus xylophilus]